MRPLSHLHTNGYEILTESVQSLCPRGAPPVFGAARHISCTPPVREAGGSSRERFPFEIRMSSAQKHFFSAKAVFHLLWLLSNRRPRH